MKTKTRNLLRNLNHPGCIVLGISSIAGLSIVRSLGTKRVCIVGIDNSEFAIGAFSKYCSSAEVFSDKSALLSLLEEIGKSTSFKNVIFCGNDKYLLFADRNRKYLENYFHLFSPQNVSLQQIINKKNMLRLAQEAGLDVPLTFFSDEHSLDEIMSKAKYPCFVKPLYTQIQIRTKGQVVRNKEELRRVINNPRFKNGYLVQQVVEGGEDRIWVCGGYCNRGNEPLILFTGHKYRQIPKGFGVTTAAISRENETVKKKAIEFLKQLRYHGCFDFEVKQCGNREEYKFIEINYRMCFWNEMIISSGIDLPYIAYCDAVGLPYQKDVKQRDGILWISIIDDFITCLKYYSKENKFILFDWIVKAFKANSYAIFRLTDMKPFMCEIVKHAMEIIHKRRRRKAVAE